MSLQHVIQAVQPKGGITLVQAQQPAFQFLILLPAQRGFAAQPFVVPAAGDLQQSAYKFHRGPRAGRTDVPVLVLYGLESMLTDFFRMSMTPSFSSSFLRSARISASSSRRRLASRFLAVSLPRRWCARRFQPAAQRVDADAEFRGHLPAGPPLLGDHPHCPRLEGLIVTRRRWVFSFCG